VLTTTAKTRAKELKEQLHAWKKKTDVPVQNNPCNNVDNVRDNDEEVESSKSDERGLSILSDEDIDKVNVTPDQLLRESGLRVLTLETVCHWMRALGFKYEPVKSHFYVDCYEKPEVKAYRDNKWIPRYKARESRMHQCIRLEVGKVKKMVEEGELQAHQGHSCTIDGIELVEFHVNDHPTFQDR